MSAFDSDILLLRRFSEAGDHAASRELPVALSLRARPQNEFAPAPGTPAARMSRRIPPAIESLQEILREKGLPPPPFAPIALLHDTALQPVPAALTAELGKMT